MSNRTIQNPVTGETITFIEPARETGGERTLMEIGVKPGGGVPMHYHTASDEEIIAIDGPLVVTIGKKTLMLQTGERVLIPKGVPHAWRNATSADVTFQARFVPGVPGFEDGLRVLAGLGHEGKLNRAGIPKDLTTFAIFARWGDSNLPGLMSVMNPILSWLAHRGEKSGLGQRLRQRYAGEL